MNPLILAAAAVALAGAIFYFRKPSGDSPGGVLPSGEPEPAAELPYGDDLPPALGSSPIDPKLSDKLEALLKGLEKSKIATPAYVATVADAFRKRGHIATAMTLARNARSRLELLGGHPYTIKGGDMASALAQTYAGRAAAWPDLIGRPSSLGVLSSYKDANGWLQLSPWRVGQVIMFPLSWNKAQQVLPPDKNVQPLPAGWGTEPAELFPGLKEPFF